MVPIAQRIADKSLELLRYQDMFTGLVAREVRARFKGSILGFFWSLLNPLLMIVIFSLVFAVYMRIEIPNYAVYLFSGLLPWIWFSTSVSNATVTLAANANLIKKVYFPLEILPLVNVTSNLVNFALSLPVLLLAMAVTQVAFTPALVYLLPIIALQFLLTLGIAFILTTYNVFFRDIEQLVNPLLLALFYVTPIIYAESHVPGPYRWILDVNPLAPLIGAYHRVLLEGSAPTAQQLWLPLVYAMGFLFVGYTAFNRRKFTFAEVV